MEEQIIELYMQGKTVREITAIVHKGYSFVYDTVKAKGIMRTKGNRKSNRCKNKEVKEVIEEPTINEPVNCDKVYKTCVYGVSRKDGIPYRCDYLSIVGHSRGCDPQYCTKYIRGKSKRGQKKALCITS